MDCRTASRPFNAALAASVCALGFLAGSAPIASAADEALIAAARKEGQVTWYTTQIINQFTRPAADAFQKKYGIQPPSGYVGAKTRHKIQTISGF